MKKPVQNCKMCAHAGKCYHPKASPRNVVINILVCRIRMGINRNESAKLLLNMIKPQLIKLVSNARSMVGSGYIDMDTLLLDLESRVIEYILSDDGYRIGDTVFFTEYMFGTNPKTGWVRKWILWGFSKDHRFYKRNLLLGIDPRSDSLEEMTDHDRSTISDYEDSNCYDYDVEKSSSEAVRAVMDIIDDGYTLNTNEYRVLSFCLSHANETNKARLIDGIHIYLSEIMSVSRPRITRLYSVSKTKIKNATREKGINL